MKNRAELFFLIEILVAIILVCLVINKYTTAPRLQTESTYVSPVPMPAPAPTYERK